MANIHVLDGSVIGDVIHKRIAFHFIIPDTDQVTGIEKDPTLVAFESAVPNISQVELDAIKSGLVIEIVVMMKYHVSESADNIETRIRALYKSMATRILDEHKNRYHQYLIEFIVN